VKKMPLPSPRSPAELDEKILAHAKRQAPERKFKLRPIWLSGLVTASVVAVAVLIAIPQQPEPRVYESEAAPERRRSDMPVSAPMSLEKKMTSRDTMGITADYALRESAAAPAVEQLDDSTLQSRLLQLSRILENGDSKQAEAAYEQLKFSCGDCELPATLEEAITKYLKLP